MARARNIKPGFFTNDVLGELPPLARLMFAGLWTLCDRAGRVEDRPKKIRAEVLPYDECDPDALLGMLERAGFIARYAAGGMQLIQVLAWDKHQNPHVKEAVSSLPAQCKHQTSTVLVAEVPAPAGLIPDSGFRIPDSSSPTVHIAAAAAPAVGGKQKSTKTAMPADFGVSERVRMWATEKGYGQLDEHLDALKRKVAANGYRKVSWDDFLMEAIREDWAKLRGRTANGAVPPPETVKNAGADQTRAYLESREAQHAADNTPEARKHAADLLKAARQRAAEAQLKRGLTA